MAAAAPTVPLPAAQQVQIVGNYELRRSLGAGSVARVVQATHIPTDTRLAMKIVRKDRVPEAHYVGEANAMRALAHRYIARLYEIVDTEKEFCLVTDCGPRTSIAEYIAKHGRLREGDVQKVMRMLVAALEHMHARGVVHKNITPSNVLYDGRWLMVIDFGCAAKTNTDDILASAQGLEAYCAPEILSRRRKIGPEADVWSLGVLLYHLVEGHSPFPTDSLGVEGVLQRQMKGAYEPMRRGSGQCHDLVRHMLNASARDRIRLEELRAHPWIGAGYTPNEGKRDDAPGHLAELKEDIAGALLSAHAKDLVLARMSEMSFDRDWTVASVAENRCNQASATFHFLAPKVRNALLCAERKARVAAEERERAERERKEAEAEQQRLEEQRRRMEEVEKRRSARLERERRLEAARKEKEYVSSCGTDAMRVEAGLQELMRNLDGRANRRKKDAVEFVEATRTLLDIGVARRLQGLAATGEEAKDSKEGKDAKELKEGKDKSQSPSPRAQTSPPNGTKPPSRDDEERWHSPLGDLYGANIVDIGSSHVRRLLASPVHSRRRSARSRDSTARDSTGGSQADFSGHLNSVSQTLEHAGVVLATLTASDGGGHTGGARPGHGFGGREGAKGHAADTGADMSEAAAQARIKNMESGVFRPPSLMKRGSLIGARMSIAITAIQQHRLKEVTGGEPPFLPKRGSSTMINVNVSSSSGTSTPTRGVPPALANASGSSHLAREMDEDEPLAAVAAHKDNMLQEFQQQQERRAKEESAAAARDARHARDNARIVRLAFDSDLATTRLPEVIMDETVKALGCLRVSYRPTDDECFALDCTYGEETRGSKAGSRRSPSSAGKHVQFGSPTRGEGGDDDDVATSKNLRFTAEVCKLPRPLLHGLRLRRTEGDEEEARRLFERLVSTLSL